MKSITVTQLKKLVDNKEDFQLIDTREATEHAEFNIGGSLMPFGNITGRINEIEKEKPVIFYCRKGVRSQIAIQRLEQKFLFENLYNLVGGMDAWRKEFG